MPYHRMHQRHTITKNTVLRIPLLWQHALSQRNIHTSHFQEASNHLLGTCTRIHLATTPAQQRTASHRHITNMQCGSVHSCKQCAMFKICATVRTRGSAALTSKKVQPRCQVLISHTSFARTYHLLPRVAARKTIVSLGARLTAHKPLNVLLLITGANWIAQSSDAGKGPYPCQQGFHLFKTKARVSIRLTTIT